MRLVRLLACLALGACSSHSQSGDTCPSGLDFYGVVIAGDCKNVGDSCTYRTTEWDFACGCVDAPRGTSWRCCSTDQNFLGYGADGCYSDSDVPIATGWPCCGSCVHVPWGAGGKSCACVENVWQCDDSGDGGTD